MTSDARPRPQEEDTLTVATASEEMPAPDTGATGVDATADEERRPRRRGRDGDEGSGSTSRPSLPLVPVLAVLLVLLVAGVGFLWFTRPAKSAVRTDDYVEVLQAARSGVVDMTSFDYLTLDDDLVQIRRVTTGDLKKESVYQLDSRRQQITDRQTPSNAIGAA